MKQHKHKSSEHVVHLEDISCAYAHEAAASRKKRKEIAFSIGGILSVVFVVEMIIVVALLTGPTIGMVNSLKTALDVFGGQEEQSVQVLLNVDSGANLTKILTDNEGLLSSAAQLLAPSPGGLEVREVDPSSRNVTQSPDSPPSVFMEWCQSASCMSGDGDLCATLDADLASARSPSGAPIIPLPRTFCDAVAKLNNHQCLCDSDLADANKSGEAASIVKSASMIGALCKVQMITPSSGKCGL